MIFVKISQDFNKSPLKFALSHRFQSTAGFKLGGDWGEILALGGSKSPWEVPRAIKTSPSIFCNFMKSQYL